MATEIFRVLCQVDVEAESASQAEDYVVKHVSEVVDGIYIISTDVVDEQE